MNQMIKLFTIVVSGAILFSCNNDLQKGKFTVSGELKNIPDQKIYLEEIYFSQKDPTVLDTAEIKNGKFSIAALAPEEGLYRLRLEKNDVVFIFINDKTSILFSADFKNLSLETAVFNSPANHLLRNFMTAIDIQRRNLEEKSALLQQYINPSQTDSGYNAMQKDYNEQENSYKNYILKYLDTTSNPVMAAFSLEYTRSIEPEKLEKPVSGLIKRFPGNQAIVTIVSQYSQMIAQYKAKPHEGGTAPDINMADTSGKPFALSMLRGKYVLVDFWASWCGPCREENPNVVKAYSRFKDKNFTVLGVSLDKDRASWLKAIGDDNLTWYHISDLKYWNSAAVNLYGFDGIPYNVLVNPDGKIIGSNLRGGDLETKLLEFVK
ncbi:MAG: TlpA disulfide reductase family protein [Ferruginibacter sp.]